MTAGPTAAPPTAAPPTAAPYAGVTQRIPIAAIAASPFNPRKTFEGIEELAESIKATGGLLENLVVRPVKGGTFELVAGERRWRALKLAKIDATDCKVMALDDGQARAAQIVENLQREDIRPLEEAEAFRQLQDSDPKTWTAQAIADKVGKTKRFVLQRIQIARGLSEPLKKAFDAGELAVEVARTLAPLPKSVQSAIPPWAFRDAADVRRQAFELCIPESAAKFDLALYKGEWIEDDKQRKYFYDVAQFTKLQRPAAEKKLEEVRKEWPKAELVDAGEAEKLYWADQDYAYANSNAASSPRTGDIAARFVVAKEKTRAIVWIARNGQVRKALGVATEAQITAATNARYQARNAASRVEVRESAARKKARADFNTAVAAAFKKPPADFALRLQLLARLTDGLTNGGLSGSKGLLPETLRGCEFNRWSQKDKHRAEIWRAIAVLPAKAIADTLARLALAEPPKWHEHTWKQTPPLMVAIAESLDVALPDELKGRPKPKPAAKKKAAAK